MNIACWSGPRNLSTALMYAFGARPDCAIWDEPFYAAYLAATGLDHPLRAAVIASGEPDPDAVARRCIQPAPGGAAHWFQKHMTHHMLPGFPRGWFAAVAHVFLIRHPARVLASYAAKRENPALEDLGFAQQTEIASAVQALGQPLVVIDSADIRRAPQPMLQALCDAIGLPFSPTMLRWPAGGHPDDGVWASHWYDAVHRSTGFAGPEGALPQLPHTLQPVLEQAVPHYQQLKAQAIALPADLEACP